MLLLSRRVGESVVIGRNVFLTVVGTENGNIRLAFEAPKNIEIDRLERSKYMSKNETSAAILFEQKNCEG